MENVWKKWFIRAGVPTVIELLTNVKQRSQWDSVTQLKDC